MACDDFESKSFYISVLNKDFIKERVKAGKKAGKKKFNASTWLDDVLDHLRAKGSPEKSKPKNKVTKFKSPAVEEVFNYCNERCNNVNAQKFVDFYDSKNWMVGKNKMKDWKASVRTWEQKEQPPTKTDDNFNTIKGWIDG